MTRKITLLTAVFGLAIGNNVNASLHWNGFDQENQGINENDLSFKRNGTNENNEYHHKRKNSNSFMQENLKILNEKIEKIKNFECQNDCLCKCTFFLLTLTYEVSDTHLQFKLINLFNKICPTFPWNLNDFLSEVEIAPTFNKDDLIKDLEMLRDQYQQQ